MTSFKQFEANRRNVRKSTRPVPEAALPCNAVRHGLTAETVIGALEDAEDYQAFEAAIIADYDAQSAVERDLVLRSACLLWRLRRATTMETGAPSHALCGQGFPPRFALKFASPDGQSDALWLVTAIKNRAPPLWMVAVPLHSFLNARFKCLSRAPSKLALDLRRIDSIASVMSWPVGYK